MENLSTCKVLIVDDELISLLGMKVFVESLNCSVITASNGKEAIEILYQQPSFDLLLTDIHMPAINGIELTKIIRQSNLAFSDILIFGITSYLADSDILKAKKAGMSEIFMKPLDLDQFKRNMLNFLKDQQKADQIKTSANDQKIKSVISE